jgi:dTDP-4-dehydrorhamnose reductase
VNILLAGGRGQLGTALRADIPAGVTLVAPNSTELDLTRAGDAERWLHLTHADVVINAAAYTMVDRAEDEPERAYAVNAGGAAAMAAAVAAAGARMIQISTDYVFDGRATKPYATGAAPAPLGVYGASKRAGELAVLSALRNRATVLRTAWLYDAGGQNFFTKMLRLMRERTAIQVVGDQTGAPTAAASVASAIWRIVTDEAVHGIHHWTDRGEVTRYDFATAIERLGRAAGLLRRQVEIRAIRTGEYPASGRRPPYSVLDLTLTSQALGLAPRDWLVALECTVTERLHLETHLSSPAS